MTARDATVRTQATGVLVQLSIRYPLELRSTSEALLARLDDVDPNVRHNVLMAIGNLATWYPQDFADGTDLMVESLRSDHRDERVVAATTLAKLAYYRPDLVTPREEALRRLRDVRQRDSLDDTEEVAVESELLDGAVQALEGGDMASRALEDDLVPSGKRAPLSKPARVGITALLWFPLVMVSMFTWMYRVWKLARKYRPHGAHSAADGIYVFFHMCLDTVAKLFFLWPPSRGRLYARRSFLVTPTRLVPWFAGTTPTKAKRRQTPPYPDDWATMATLVRQRDGHQCRNCGALGGPRDGDAELHVDHQHPRSRDGPDHPSNLRTLCRSCHEARHGRPFDD
ncbi:HNH endonuclease [Haloarcula onubensis]|uniref:HNH endonuclease n=1 Tax=Haloarcula onubensis TaxID=2950539 RepID=A0ABU2FQ45_9EURY|nr:HNH endonuclease [Halomicroarcula sp. S3CR25-11]MDS0282868.1 HNH endonuclease [Halomicroarcula sp. S3CR25-11]